MKEKTAMHMVMDILRNSGCLDFIEQGSKDALTQIEKRQPEGFACLTDGARECLMLSYRERLEMIYTQVLIAEVSQKLKKYDPAGLLLGRMKPEPVQAAVQDLKLQAAASLEEYLYTKYPLLDKYNKQIRMYYVDCFSEFLQAFYTKKDELSAKLLGGRAIHSILHLSAGGADIHRNGRCVIGVRTDAGTVYYKPHNCGLDVLYHKIVQTWFSDCTVAADVVEGSGFAFVSCLKHEPVSGKDDIAVYYYHFGMLAALFHGLGSSDMHMENIISCGDKPAAVDVETILGTAVRSGRETGQPQEWNKQKELSGSLLRTGLLPLRVYKGPLVSPLYSCREDDRCLPEYEGQFHTVEGYEEAFTRGFREGYGRVLNHREDILELIDQHQNATVRCLLRNTRFYNLIRQMLYRPEYLSGDISTEKVYAKLCSPYIIYGEEPEPEITQYEWQCLLKGDIPYYCTTASGKDLCGENPGQIIRKDYYQSSVMDSVKYFLARLSPEEEAFELDLMRVILAHAPIDVKPEKTLEPISIEAATEERLEKETARLFRTLKQDAIHCADDRLIWVSTAESLEMIETFGSAAMYGNAGMFAARIAVSGRFPELYEEAMEMAGTMCRNIAQILDLMEQLDMEDGKTVSILPTGLYTGLGSVILSCREMAQAGIKEASGLAGRIVRISLEHCLYRYKKTNAAEGTAGLILALSALEKSRDVITLSCAAADWLLEEDLPDRADLPFGCAGIGAAFAAAYGIYRDIRYRQKALEAFRKVQEEYKPELSGWPEGHAKIKWLADKGPHAAGIYLAAGYAQEMLYMDPLPGKICNTSLESMLEEQSILHLDVLNQGNALFVLALLKAGRRIRAGQILSAMLKRKERTGCFSVTPPGIRSSFDPSYYMGTTGIAYAIMEFLASSRGSD